MVARPAVLTIPAEVREPLDAACFVFPRGARAVHIDMRGVRWIAPVGVAALLAQCLQSRGLETDVRVLRSECFVVAQTHTGERSGAPGVHIAIADFGEGFMRTLAAYHPASEAEAIEKAFEDGVTGTGEMRGSGLAEARRYIDGYPGARLAIASRTGFVERANRSFRRAEGPDCGGVFVSVRFPYRGMPSPL